MIAFRYLDVPPRPRQAAGVIVQAVSTGRVLLGLRSMAVRNPGLWGVFGGGVEPGEAPVDAAARELREEAGFRCTIVRPLRSTSGRFHAFLGLVPREVRPRINWESAAAGWFDPWDLPEPLHPGTVELVRQT